MPPAASAFEQALVLTGPTGSGKSGVALEVAERIGAEIVSMDSMTLYRGMDIGTAKPSREDRTRIRHHLIDVLDPWESANVAWWLEHAAEACAEIRARGLRPIFVGGTPFYLKALLHGLFDSPPVEPEVRRRLEQEAEQLGKLAFHHRLREVDPKTAERLHPNDVRRVVRALEVWSLTGKPISAFQQTWDDPPARLPCVYLDWPREELYRRIDARVLAMLDAGWLEEVRCLKTLPRAMSSEASQALGYRELRAFLESVTPDWTETVQRIQTATRQFAKRQLTWFRSLPGCIPCPAANVGLVDRVVEIWSETESRTIGEET